MRRSTWLLSCFLVTVFITHGTALGAQQARGAANAKPTHSDSGYSNREADFTVGRRVYLRSTRTLIGTIIAIDPGKSFPPERFARAKMKAVLIKRFDGPMGWMPVEGITRIYVTR